VANVTEVKCKGCGCCGSSCIERAITMRGFTDEQLMLQAKAALIAEEPRPKEVKAVVTE